VVMPIVKSVSFLSPAQACAASGGGRCRRASVCCGVRSCCCSSFRRQAGRGPRASSGCPRKRRCGRARTASSRSCWRRSTARSAGPAAGPGRRSRSSRRASRC
jgi:hypothetical protein